MASSAVVFVTQQTRAVGETAMCDIAIVFVTWQARRKDEMVMVGNEEVGALNIEYYIQ